MDPFAEYISFILFSITHSLELAQQPGWNAAAHGHYFFRWVFQTAPLSIIWAASWLLSNWWCSRFIILVSHDRSDAQIQNLRPTFNQSDHAAAEPIISATNLRGPQALNRIVIVHHWGCDGNRDDQFRGGYSQKMGFKSSALLLEKSLHTLASLIFFLALLKLFLSNHYVSVLFDR